MVPLNLTTVATNIELLLGDFFSLSYNEHRGPIQLIQQIERVRSNRFFESDDFYRLVVGTDMTMNVRAREEARNVVDAHVKGWAGVAITRRIELDSVVAWNGAYYDLGDLIWGAYLHVQSGGRPSCMEMQVLNKHLRDQIEADDGQLHYATEIPERSLEASRLTELVTQAKARLKEVS